MSKAEEFDKKLEIMLNNDELSAKEIVVNVAQMREAYHQARLNEVSEEYIEDAHSKMINISKSVGFINGAKWLLNKLKIE